MKNHHKDPVTKQPAAQMTWNPNLNIQFGPIPATFQPPVGHPKWLF